MDIVESFEKEFVDKKRIWERIEAERLDLSGVWRANVRNALDELPLTTSRNLSMSVASYFLITKGCRGVHGYPSPLSLISTWMYNPSYRNKFSVEEIDALLKLKHYFKAI